MSDCARSFNDGYNEGFKSGLQWAAYETYIDNILAARENEIRRHQTAAALDRVAAGFGNVGAETDQADTVTHTVTEPVGVPFAWTSDEDIAASQAEAERLWPGFNTRFIAALNLDRLDTMPATRWTEPADDADTHILRSVN